MDQIQTTTTSSGATNVLKATVLIVEDDPAIRRLLKAAFKDTGFDAIEAETGESGIAAAVKEQPDIILLDLGLPDVSGLQVVKTVRSWSACPIIMLSATGQEKMKVECLEAGADDYITKPFGVNELLARLRVAHRRALATISPNATSVFESGGVRVDLASREVTVNGQRIHLTPLEYKLLTALIRHAGKVVTHRQLLSDVWGPDYAEEWQYLRLYVGYLRRKIPGGQDLILNEPGVGYRLILTDS